MAVRGPKAGLGAQVWSIRPFKQIYSTLGAIREITVPERPLGCIVGPAGMGKTFACSSFRENTPDIRIVTVPPKDILTPRSLLVELASVLGVTPGSEATVAALHARVCNELAQRPYMVIVDEADRLRPSNADLLRDIAEMTSRAFCFVGCPALLNVLDRVEATHHRVGIRYAVEALSQADLESALLNKALDASDAPMVRKLDRDAIASIYHVTAGNLRHIAALLNLLRSAREPGSFVGVALEPRKIQAINDRFLKAA
jgi:DNA transposition AAA+ family ATPase